MIRLGTAIAKNKQKPIRNIPVRSFFGDLNKKALLV
jgi:hypothetical protein